MAPRPRARAGARLRHTAGAVLLALAATGTATGCDAAKEAAGDLVSSATAAVASAAQQKMDEIKDGVNATGDVTAGATSVDGDRTVATITATNPKSSAADYTVMVTFRDDGGNLLDTVVLNIDAVPAGASKSGTARSNRTLSGATTAEITQALRH
ncbi:MULTISPECIES: hypothetical protein [Streptomyces]|uniref:Lipoprotein n=1 Tax=Streptomyces hydrogenans TaxID=1873719 RepID=A0ABQ3PG16_9ACTN|nr:MULTISPECIES: hypothetical protein [Streptomyces]MCM1945512.1 hypothetical protein [Streptomyces sp. G2]GHG12906.1 hypothetical protein GCM10018784_27190 [Streptomyces hydrogenans]GHI23945.1 hypothetical protein Shyd_53160 [Streptomyces hydrogenans]